MGYLILFGVAVLAGAFAFGDDGGDEAEVVEGDSGNDTLITGSGDDTLYGNAGDDGLFAGDGDDRVFAGAGDDIVLGGDDNDIVDGGPGADVLEGNGGTDTLISDADDVSVEQDTPATPAGIDAFIASFSAVFQPANFTSSPSGDPTDDRPIRARLANFFAGLGL